MQWWTWTVLTILSALLISWYSFVDFKFSRLELGRYPVEIQDLQAIECENSFRPQSNLPEDWSLGAFMQIYVRGYKDTDGDGIGDLNGVTESLDYLHDLGITGLWLMPITGT